MPLVNPDFTGQVDATVFIPTFNGEKYLNQLLNSVENQEYFGNFEILVVDSGSRDATLDILRGHPAVKVVEIPSAEFGHGKTRNLAAQLARGTYIAYLSHDAIPADNDWLDQILTPLNPTGMDCVGVVGKHIARDTCFPLLKYEIAGVFRECGPDETVTIVDGAMKRVEEMSPGEKFYSDVNSATRREFLLKEISYRDINYSEDMAFAHDFLAAGFRKAYAPGAVVVHSNDVTLAEYGKRIFDENIGLRRIAPPQPPVTWPKALLRFLKDAVLSSFRILADADYSLRIKMKWLLLNPVYVWRKWLNIHRATCISLSDTRNINKYSLEASRK